MTRKIEPPSARTLQKWRDEGYTHQEIADLRSVSRATVSRWYAALDAEQFESYTGVPQTVVVSTRKGGR